MSIDDLGSELVVGIYSSLSFTAAMWLIGISVNDSVNKCTHMVVNKERSSRSLIKERECARLHKPPLRGC